jgi:hypothetical protein
VVHRGLEKSVRRLKSAPLYGHKLPLFWCEWALLCEMNPLHLYNQDGNDRLSRTIASIPLLKAGYPQISVPAEHRQVYYEAPREVFYDSVTTTHIRPPSETMGRWSNVGFVNGMRPAINSLSSLFRPIFDFQMICVVL